MTDVPAARGRRLPTVYEVFVHSFSPTRAGWDQERIDELTVLLRLAPWIFYAIGIHVGGRRDAALFAAISAALIIALSLLRRSRATELILDGSTLVFFVGFWLFVRSHPDAQQVHYVAAGAQLFQGAVILLFVLFGIPFTLPIAQRSVPEDVGQSRPFFRFNVKLTVVWLLGFLLSGAVLVALARQGNDDTGVQISIIAASVVIPYLIQRSMVSSMERRQVTSEASPEGPRLS